jgi:hypothetical protein
MVALTAAATRSALREMREGQDKVYGTWLKADFLLVEQPLRNRCPGYTNVHVVRRRTLRMGLYYISEMKLNNIGSYDKIDTILQRWLLTIQWNWHVCGNT